MTRGRRWLMLTTADMDGVGAIWAAWAPARDLTAAAAGGAGPRLALDDDDVVAYCPFSNNVY